MFGRKERKALEGLPPQHHELVEQRQLSVSQTPAQWLDLFASFTANQETVHKHPLPPRTNEVVVPLLRILTEDVPADGYLGLRLDMTGGDVPGKATEQVSLPVVKPVRKCLQHFEFDPWLSLEARLNDRSKLDVWMADVIRVRTITKKSSSGKIKTKTKKKSTQRLRVRLAVPADRAVLAPAKGQPNWCRITMERDDRYTVLDGRAKYPIANTPPIETGFAARFHATPPGRGAAAPAQLNNVLLLVGELFRWVQPVAQERSSA